MTREQRQNEDIFRHLKTKKSKKYGPSLKEQLKAMSARGKWVQREGMGYVKMVSLEIVKMHQFASLTIDNVKKKTFYLHKKEKEEKLNPLVGDNKIWGGYIIGS